MNLLPRLVKEPGGRIQIGPPAPIVIKPTKVTLVEPTAATVIVPPARLAWDEKRWTRTEEGRSTVYTGQYRVFDRAQQNWRNFAGRIVEESGAIKTYVANPPAEIKRHSKGRCFQLVQAPWFRIHWIRHPESVDVAILYVERVLDECINATY